jgi:L-iditol 2-dehydrogenase
MSAATDEASMKALVYEGPRQLAGRSCPTPEPAADEVVVRVDSVGICGSDMHAFLGHDERRPAPLILGHEAAGVVETGPRAGARVAVNPLVSCWRCDLCLDGRPNLCAERQIISMPPREGAFAERVAIPARNLVEIPEHLSLTHAALAEPVAVSYHAVGLARRALARPLTACSAVVLGGGALGVAAALILRAAGIRDLRVADTNAGRRQTIAERIGLQVDDPAAGQGPADASVDLVVDAVGAAATRTAASRLARPGGAIVHVGLQEAEGGLDVRRLTLQEISFLGCYTYTMVDFRETVDALAQGALGDLSWIEERPLDAGPAAFEEILAGRVAAPKVVLHP